MVGTTISHYKIFEKLGEGGMGVVYRAEDTRLKRTVALKFLPVRLEPSEPERARFLQEAQAAAALNHPNICTIHDVAGEGDQQFIVMEFVDGQTLSHVVPVQNVQRAIDYAIQIGEALQEAHAKGVVHRDIKTDNIMVNARNQIKVMDFGLARLKGSLKLTRTSSTVGTLAYMAPEQIEGREVDARADIFSFGVVFYELLTGHLPFRGEHEAAVMYSILNEEPHPIQAYLPDIAPEIIHVINRAMEKDPEERYQTTHDMVIDLHRLKKETSRVARGIVTGSESRTVGVQAGAVTSGTAPVMGGARSRTRMWIWMLAGSAAFIVLIAAWFLFRPGNQEASFAAGRSTQLTSDPGIEIYPALSPDGKMIAYCSYVNRMMRVLVKQVSGGRTISLTAEWPEWQLWPDWSADGSEVAFSGSPSGIQYAVPAFGGTPRKITAGIPSPDGKLLAFSSSDTIYMRTSDAGNPEKIATVYEPHSFAWSPDGSKIAFVSGNSSYAGSYALGNIAPSSVCIISVPGGSVSQVSDRNSINMSPVWTNDSKTIFFVSNRDGTRDIYYCGVDGSGRPHGPANRLTTGLNAHTISLSGDSKTLAYSVLTFSANIWSIRIPETGSISVREATEVTVGNQAIEGVGVSRDGEWLAYDSNREGNQDIYKIPSRGGEPVRLTRDPADDFLPMWSPDGKLIAFYSFRSGNRDLFVMANDGTQQQQITFDKAEERYPDWSPDGSQIVFYSDKTGRQEIYVTARKPGSTEWNTPQQLTFDGGSQARWSPDGEWIAFTRDETLWVISKNGGSARLLVSTNDRSVLPAPTFPGWSADSRWVYYKASDASRQASFWAVPVHGGKPRLLVRFDDPAKPSVRSEFATDGKRLFFTISSYESDIWKMDLLSSGR